MSFIYSLSYHAQVSPRVRWRALTPGRRHCTNDSRIFTWRFALKQSHGRLVQIQVDLLDLVVVAYIDSFIFVRLDDFLKFLLHGDHALFELFENLLWVLFLSNILRLWRKLCGFALISGALLIIIGRWIWRRITTLLKAIYSVVIHFMSKFTRAFLSSLCHWSTLWRFFVT